MKFSLYMHGGSGNHGCEAIVRTTSKMLKPLGSITIFSKRAVEDCKYIPELKNNIISCGIVPQKTTIKGFLSALEMKLFRNHLAYVKYAFAPLLKHQNKNDVALSIGGDNYCYDGVPELLARLNQKLANKGVKTILFGCSVEPHLLKDPSVVEDLSRYSLITARESITYEAMKNANVKTEIILAPDPAFSLPVTESVLPEGFIKGNTIGINISPMILSYGSEKLFDAYCKMIQHIIETTDMQIALIPHVVWQSNNDLVPIQKIYDMFKTTNRVIKIDDCNATQLKWYIAQCKMFVGARTHSTIAAYSSCVPTLVIGYSVKSIGIAKDLFGTEENYVINSNSIANTSELIHAFTWLQENEHSIRTHLEHIMPSYIQKTECAIERIKELCQK